MEIDMCNRCSTKHYFQASLKLKFTNDCKREQNVDFSALVIDKLQKSNKITFDFSASEYEKLPTSNRLSYVN